MKRKLLIFTLTIMLSGIPSFYVNAEELNVNSDLVDAKEMLEQGEYKSRELIVIFKDNVSDRTINNVVKSIYLSIVEALSLIKLRLSPKLAITSLIIL